MNKLLGIARGIRDIVPLCAGCFFADVLRSCGVPFWVQVAGDIREGLRVDLVFFFAARGRFSDDMGRYARGHIGRVRKGNIPLGASPVEVGSACGSSRWRTLQGDCFCAGLPRFRCGYRGERPQGKAALSAVFLPAFLVETTA